MSHGLIFLGALAFSIVVAVLLGLVRIVTTLVRRVIHWVERTVNRTRTDAESGTVGPTATTARGVPPVVVMGELPRPRAEPNR